MNALNELINWFSLQCDGDWEHGEGITIETLDNPGWRIAINVEGTLLEDVGFDAIEAGDPEDPNDDCWIKCFKKDSMFIAICGKSMLESALSIFIEWMRLNTDTSPWDAEVEHLMREYAALQGNADELSVMRQLNERIETIPNEHPGKAVLRKMFGAIWDKAVLKIQ